MQKLKAMMDLLYIIYWSLFSVIVPFLNKTKPSYRGLSIMTVVITVSSQLVFNGGGRSHTINSA